jgi:hypothetical protein
MVLFPLPGIGTGRVLANEGSRENKERVLATIWFAAPNRNKSTALLAMIILVSSRSPSTQNTNAGDFALGRQADGPIRPIHSAFFASSGDTDRQEPLSIMRLSKKAAQCTRRRVCTRTGTRMTIPLQF